MFKYTHLYSPSSFLHNNHICYMFSFHSYTDKIVCSLSLERSQFHGTEFSFSRPYLLRWLGNSLHFKKPESLSPVFTRMYPRSIQNQMNPINSPSFCFKIHFNITLYLHKVFQVVSFLLVCWLQTFHISHFAPFTFCCPSHPLLFGRPNDVWGGIQTIKLFMMQFSPTFCCYLHLPSAHIFSSHTPSHCDRPRDWV